MSILARFRRSRPEITPSDFARSLAEHGADKRRQRKLAMTRVLRDGVKAGIVSPLRPREVVIADPMAGIR